MNSQLDRRYEGRTTLPEPEPSFQPMMVVDEESCSAYIYLVAAKPVQTLELSETVLADLDENGAVVGVELQDIFPEAIATFMKVSQS